MQRLGLVLQLMPLCAPGCDENCEILPPCLLCMSTHLQFKVLKNLPQQEGVAALGAVQKRLNPVVAEAVAD